MALRTIAPVSDYGLVGGVCAGFGVGGSAEGTAQARTLAFCVPAERAQLHAVIVWIDHACSVVPDNPVCGVNQLPQSRRDVGRDERVAVAHLAAP